MTLTVFFKGEVIARGTQDEVAPAMRALEPLERANDLLAFEDESGRQVDLDLRPAPPAAPRRGRPSLGVEAREVTLLPRHWEWLATRGGASATLRKLVEEAMRKGRQPKDNYEAAYRFLHAMAGDLPHFVDLVREMYAGNKVGYDHFSHEWPKDIRDHGHRLAWPEE